MQKMKRRFLSLIIVILIVGLVGSSGFLFGYAIHNISAQKIVETQTVVNEQSAIETVVQNALPSVVTIAEQQGLSSPQNIASGFIVSSKGLIMTNRHVVSDNGSGITYYVIASNNKQYQVQQIYRDPSNDLAILQIQANGLTPVQLGDSSSLKLGQTVIAIGTPLGTFPDTVTSGIISGLGRGIAAGSPYSGYVEQLSNVIQTDAAINPGNSGGPLLNTGGQVIGINTAVAEQGQNIGFAIPVNVIKDLLNKFKVNGSSFQQPYLGVRYEMIDQNAAQTNNEVQGALIVDVISPSPAASAGIEQGDIITKFAGQAVNTNTNHQLNELVLAQKVGSTVNMTLWRNGNTINTQVTLEANK
jgi:S1-C subfamily serine protease